MNHTASTLRPCALTTITDASRSMSRPRLAGSQPRPIATRRSAGAPVLTSETVCRLASETRPLSRLIFVDGGGGAGASAGGGSAIVIPKSVAMPARPLA